MRGSAFLQAAILVVIGFVLARVFGHDLPARIVWGLAAVFALLGAFWPRGYRPIHGCGRTIGRMAGKLLTYVLLVPLYVVFFAVVAVYLRIRHKDPLRREFLPGIWTYWIPRREKRRDENIGDQFLREDREARERRRPVGAVTRNRESDPA
ncbi:hypothetical protein KKG45_09380 [bacterium]|nr:hypothetical protein [bacterium]MBU1073446.1 hypothetical protein [bacterium]MBU1674336.1 hypothetical protein [bacterium]